MSETTDVLQTLIVNDETRAILTKFRKNALDSLKRQEGHEEDVKHEKSYRTDEIGIISGQTGIDKKLLAAFIKDLADVEKAKKLREQIEAIDFLEAKLNG